MDADNINQLLAFDSEHLWHPYASLQNPPPAYPVVAARGVHLELADGRKLLDGMSSWWSAIHGYNHPVLNKAAIDQLAKMSHVMFGGITHPPAVELGRRLVDISSPSMTKVFLSDSGSVAVEVAIKMAFQYWLSQGERRRTKLLTVKNGYHGDTFAAMSVCDPVNGMHQLFSGVISEQLFAPAPGCSFNEPCAAEDIREFEQLLSENTASVAAVILEPIVQGAGGMRFYSPQYLAKVRQLCDEHGVLLILDEIATGFGRSGKLFAAEHAAIEGDIVCVGKAITGGYMSLAATLCSNKIADGICQGEAGALMHGPTFMANPLACAIACASIDLLMASDWAATIARMENTLCDHLMQARHSPLVQDVRVLGAIGVIEMKQPVDMVAVQKAFVDAGIWIRPFGKLVYIMPPYIMNQAQLELLAGTMVDIVTTR